MEKQEPKLSDELAKKRTGMADKRTDMADKRTGMADKRTDLADRRTNLAAKRNFMAADRTMMAWSRTGLSMIGFGFTIYKFLQYLSDAGQALMPNPEGPRRIGIFLIALGTAALLAGAIQYWKTMKDLSKDYDCTPWSFSFVFALLMSLLGLFLITTIVAKINFI